MTIFSGEKLQRCLFKAGMTEVELALRIGMRKETISRYINNRNEPKLATIAAMARVLGVNTKELLEERRK